MICVWEKGRIVKVQAQIKPDNSPPIASGDEEEGVQYMKFTVKIYKADDIPSIDSGIMAQVRKTFCVDTSELLDLYVQVFLGGLKGTTSKIKRTLKSSWDQQIVFTGRFPAPSHPIVIQVRDDEIMVNQVVGTAVIQMDKISNPDSGGFLPTFGPCYVHLHETKELHASEDDISYRGRLLMAISSEIITNPNLKKPYVVVEPTSSLPEGICGCETDFLLFACIWDATMIERRIADKKKIRFTIQFGPLPEHAASIKYICPTRSDAVPKSSWMEGFDNRETTSSLNNTEHCSEFMQPIATNKRYCHLPIKENKKCLWLKTSWPDCRRRMYISNILEKIGKEIESCIQVLYECLDLKNSTKEDDTENALKELETTTLYFLKILKENWDMFSCKTQLDVERWKIYHNILEQVSDVYTMTLDRPIIQVALRKMEVFLHELRRIEEDNTKEDISGFVRCRDKEHDISDLLHSTDKDISFSNSCLFLSLSQPQPTLPDVVVWMENNHQKRIGYCKMAARDLLFSLNEAERGRNNGKIRSLYFRPVSRKKSDDVIAKVNVYLWLGLLKHVKYCEKSLPQGFESDFSGQDTEAADIVPRVLCYHEKQAYFLRAHIYQARSLPWSDMSRFPSPVAQLFTGNRCLYTQIRENTLNPIWDETLTFTNLSFYGETIDIASHPPDIVIEIYNSMITGKSTCICRGIIPIVHDESLHENPPLLKWYNITSKESGEPTQLLAAFELVLVKMQEGAGDELDDFYDRSFDVGPVMPIPPSIRPHFSPHRIEVLFWGLRELKRVNLMSVEGPRLELECGGNVIYSSIITNYKKHSNFVKMVEIIDMDLPEREAYFPTMIIKLQDCKSFGRRNVLASHVVHSLQKYVVKANGQLLEPKYEKSAENIESYTDVRGIVINMESSEQSPFYDSYIFQKMRIPWTHSEPTADDNLEKVEAEEEQDWWSRYYLSTGESLQHRKSEAMYIRTSVPRRSIAGLLPTNLGVSRNTRPRQSVIPDLRRSTLGQLINKRDEFSSYNTLDAKAFVIYPCELENVSEFRGFEEWLHSFELTHGRKVPLFHRRQKTVAIFKGCFRIYELPLPRTVVDSFLPSGDHEGEGLFHGLPENKPTKVLVRAYIVKAIDLTPSDVTNTTDAYIAIHLGKQKLVDKDNYISKQLNPVFGKCFEFVANFPSDSILTIQVMDWDLMGSDDLIGETKIDLENRFYSRHRPTCGLARTYETRGPNAWRDVFTPLEILTKMCQNSGLGTPQVTGKDIRIAQIVYDFDDARQDEKASEQDMALYLLHRWQDISPGKFPLVPEHLETRTLYHPSKPGEPQGKLLMWLDMFPENTVPPIPPRDISIRKPSGYELRVIIWNTDEVVLADDAFFTGEKMSDIYVKAWLAGKEDAQCTDVHYRSLTGEGNFNWRFVFPFDYLAIERKIVVMKKVSVFSWDETEFKMPLELTLQIWDADHFKSDDCLGELRFNLHHFPRGAKSAPQCSLEMLRGNEHVPQISLFKQRRVRGWWPVASEIPNGGRELTGKVEAEFHLLTREEANESPVGMGRKEPDPLKEPRRPETSFVNYLHPLKAFRYTFWKLYRKRIIIVLILFALALIVLLFVYSVPGYTAKKVMGV